MSREIQRLEITKITEEINSLQNDIINNTRNILANIIEIGKRLTEVKNFLPHGAFQSWVETELEITPRTAQRYMKVYEHREQIESVDIEKLSDAYKLLEKPKNDTRVAFDEELQEEELPEIPSDEQPKQKQKKKQTTEYEYWKYLKPLIEYMIKTYEVLASTRTHTTPVALGDMFGNIKEMALRLDTWDPSALRICPKCGGDGVIIENGKQVKCEYCINGKVGISRPTDY